MRKLFDKIADDLYPGAPSDCEYDFINWVERRHPTIVRKFAAAKRARGNFRTVNEVADKLYPGAPSDCYNDFIDWVERHHSETLRKFAAADWNERCHPAVLQKHAATGRW